MIFLLFSFPLLLPARKWTRSRKKGRRGRDRKQDEVETEKKKRSRKAFWRHASYFSADGKKNVSVPFFLPPQLPLLALPMTRSHTAASAALLACSLLLCAASCAQVRGRERSFFIIVIALLLLQSNRARIVVRNVVSLSPRHASEAGH